MLNATNPIAAALACALATSAAGALAGPLGDHPRAADRIDMRLERMAEQLDLTEAQQEEIRAILEQHHDAADAQRAQLRERVDGVLTQEQLALRDGQIESRLDRRLDRMAERLDLTDAQREEIQAIMAERRNDPALTRTELRERMADVLSAEQLAQLDALRKRHGPGRHGGPGGDRAWAPR